MSRQAPSRFGLIAIFSILTLAAFAFAGWRLGYIYGSSPKPSTPLSHSARIELAQKFLLAMLESEDAKGAVKTRVDGSLLVLVSESPEANRDSILIKCDLHNHRLFADIPVEVRFE